jgi:anti-sigma regulatory factor (Ser/Thr protein kinase)
MREHGTTVVPDTVSVTLVNRRAEIERLAHAVEAFGRTHALPDSVVFSLNLALDEIVSNIIRYAYDDGAKHEILVGLALEDGVVRVEIQDAGRAFNPLDVPPVDLTAAAEDRPVGGLGLHLVRSLMDGLEYRREDGRNVLTMTKTVGPRSS